MGMDVYLYEVTEEGDKEIYVNQNFPPEILEKSFECEEEYIDIEKIKSDYDIKEIIGACFNEIGVTYIDETKDVFISWDEIDEKYIIAETVKKVKVRQLAYARYGYISNHFKVHPFCNGNEVKEYGLKTYYFEPEDMVPVLQIFRQESRDKWEQIIDEFRNAKTQGKLCFVFVSW